MEVWNTVRKKIDDFGEKIGGAKKDTWGKRGLSINDVNDKKVEEYIQYITKDNIWPIPEYTEYIDKGMEPVCIYLMKNIRDKVKPKLNIGEITNRYNLVNNYISFINNVRDCCENTLNITDARNFVDRLIYGYGYKDDKDNWGNKAYNTPGFNNTFIRAIYKLQQDLTALGYEAEIQNFPYSFRGDLKGVTIRQKYNKKFCIAGGRNIFIRDKDFDTVDEALEFAKTNLIKMLDREGKGKKSRTHKIVRPQLAHIQRTGPDVRGGKNLKPEALINIFKFRGGEFGNWNTQADRQAYVNYAFDALIDLAHATKIPAEFISLGGSKKLAIAFGSRGRGRASAHYEPERVVINLTKINGAGSLAHEWGHALDHFLGYQCNVGRYISNYKDSSQYGHKNIIDKFKAIMSKIKTNESGMGTNYYREAKRLDRGKAKPYYSKEEELFARAFESFVEDRLGFKSDYLVHSTSNSCYGELNPYPSGSEREAINKAIEELMTEAIKEFAYMYKQINPEIYSKNTDWSDKYDKNRVIKKDINTIEKNQNITSTKELREKLVDSAFKILPGNREVNNKELIEIILRTVRNDLNIGAIEIGYIPANKARGNSKGWATSKGTLIVNGKEREEKILESIIEPIVMVLMMRKFGNSQETLMVSSGVTYMICKRLGLDVRTYCVSDEFERLVRHKNKIEVYNKICTEEYYYTMDTMNIKEMFV